MSFVVRLQWFFKMQWKQYAKAIILMTLVSLLTTVPPKMIGNTIDHIRNGNLTSSDLTRTVLLLLVLAVSLYIMVLMWIRALFGNSVLVEKLLRGRLLAHLTKMTPGFFQRNSTGQLMALATNDVLAIGSNLRLWGNDACEHLGGRLRRHYHDDLAHQL